MKFKFSESFDLDSTLACGQVFRWIKTGNWWRGIISGNIVNIRKKNCTIEFQTYPSDLSENFIISYFRLDDDIKKIYNEINKDKHISNAIDQFKGMRLIRQEPWECLISYVCATGTNISRIRKMIENIAIKFGTLIKDSYYSFPTPNQLYKVTEGQLNECGLGFRAKYVKKIVTSILKGNLDFDTLRGMRYEPLIENLKCLDGVGEKVADCVALFSFEKLNAFPIDVWIRRVLTKYYNQKGPYKKLRNFAQPYFGKYAGYGQEYLYHRERSIRFIRGPKKST